MQLQHYNAIKSTWPKIYWASHSAWLTWNRTGWAYRRRYWGKNYGWNPVRDHLAELGIENSRLKSHSSQGCDKDRWENFLGDSY